MSNTISFTQIAKDYATEHQPLIPRPGNGLENAWAHLSADKIPDAWKEAKRLYIKFKDDNMGRSTARRRLAFLNQRAEELGIELADETENPLLITRTTDPWVCTTWDVEGGIRPGETIQQLTRGVASKDLRWDPDTVLNVYFLEGTSDQQDAFMAIAKEWFLHDLSLKLDKTSSGSDAQIRVTFKPGFNQSYVGKENLQINNDLATLNVAKVTRNRVLHEFGHALGLLHEFTHPDANFQWIKEEVYNDYKNDYNWGKDMVDRWVFERFSPSSEVITAFDKNSVMVYPIQANWTTSRIEITPPNELSDGDKRTIHNLYPG